MEHIVIIGGGGCPDDRVGDAHRLAAGIGQASRNGDRAGPLAHGLSRCAPGHGRGPAPIVVGHGDAERQRRRRRVVRGDEAGLGLVRGDQFDLRPVALNPGPAADAAVAVTAGAGIENDRGARGDSLCLPGVGKRRLIGRWRRRGG